LEYIYLVRRKRERKLKSQAREYVVLSERKPGVRSRMETTSTCVGVCSPGENDFK
jgi:hypothetical protein